VRGLRNAITEALGRAGIECGLDHVVLSGGPGYRLSDTITVQYAHRPQFVDIGDIDKSENVPDVPSRSVPNVPDRPGDLADARRSWILDELKQGRQLKAGDIAERFACALKTAQRDLASLKEEGKIEFVGSPRTGFYRLLEPGPPGN
jgi:hypothetical protein